MSRLIDDQRLDESEYMQEYVNDTYHLDKHFDSITVPNFLSDEELAEFDQAMSHEETFHVVDTSMTKAVIDLCGFEPEKTADYYIFDRFYTKPCWSHLVDIIQPKLEKHLGEGLYASHIHVLDSYVPYGIHSDSEQPNIALAPHPAWTLIIPFDDYPSKTYQFHQRSNHKSPWDWVHAENIEPWDDYSISRELWEKDFAPLTDYEMFRYLSVESTFEWKKGSMFAADRFRFHSSDNYFNHGIKNKKALIMWTSLKE